MAPREPARLIRLFEEEIPFNKLLGMKVVELGEGSCVLRVPARPGHVGDRARPALHGGVLATLADTAGGLAVFSQLDQTEACSTVDLRIDFLRPGQPERAVYARSAVIRRGNRVAAVDTTVYQDDDTSPIARTVAVYNVVRRRPETTG